MPEQLSFEDGTPMGQLTLFDDRGYIRYRVASEVLRITPYGTREKDAATFVAGRRRRRRQFIAASVGVAVLSILPAAFKYGVHETANYGVRVLQEEADNIDLSQAQVDKFKRRIEREDISGFLLDQLRQERENGEINFDDFLRVVFDIQSSSDTENQTGGSGSDLTLDQQALTDFEGRLSNPQSREELLAEIHTGTYDPDELFGLLFPGVETGATTTTIAP